MMDIRILGVNSEGCHFMYRLAPVSVPVHAARVKPHNLETTNPALVEFALPAHVHGTRRYKLKGGKQAFCGGNKCSFRVISRSHFFPHLSYSVDNDELLHSSEILVETRIR